jgi:putative transposase
VWAYDFVEVRNHDGRKFCILAIIDEASREYLALFVARKIRSVDVQAILAELFLIHRPPAHIRPDNGPEFIAITLKEWLAPVGVQIVQSLAEAQILIEAWRRHYNSVRPHSLLGFSLPAPEAVPWPLLSSGSASLYLR